MRRGLLGAAALVVLLPLIVLSHGIDYKGTSIFPANYDPLVNLFGTCDFITGAGGSGTTCELGLGQSAISGGSGANTTGLAANPGLFRYSSHATNDNSGVLLWYGNGGATGVTNNTWDARDWFLDVIFKPGSNSTAITNAAWYVGLANTVSADPASVSAGIWIRHDSDDSDTAHVFAVCNSATAGCNSAGDDTAQKTVASTITPVAGTFYRYRIRQVMAGVGGARTIYMQVNDEAPKTFCVAGCDNTLATVPAGTALNPLVVYLTRTTTGVLSGDIDIFTVSLTNTSARY